MAISISFLILSGATVLVFSLAVREFRKSLILYKKLSPDGDSFFHWVHIRSNTWILGLTSAIVIAGLLHFISQEEFIILLFLYIAGAESIFLVRSLIDKEKHKIEVREDPSDRGHILRLRKEELQFLRVSIVFFAIGFGLMSIQYLYSNQGGLAYVILTGLLIPPVEAIAIFSLLFWIIWHFSRRSEERKNDPS